MRVERTKQLMKKAQKQYSEKYDLVIVPEIMSRKMVSYCGMKKDLEEIYEFIKLLKNKPEKIISASLNYSMIALYGKCFTDASKNSYPKLEPKHIFTDYKELNDLHDELMQYRHDFIAHRGKSDGEVSIVFMAIPKASEELSTLKYSHLKLNRFSIQKLNRIEILIKFLREIVDEKISKSGKKTYNGFFNEFSIEEIKHMVLTNAK